MTNAKTNFSLFLVLLILFVIFSGSASAHLLVEGNVSSYTRYSNGGPTSVSYSIPYDITGTIYIDALTVYGYSGSPYYCNDPGHGYLYINGVNVASGSGSYPNSFSNVTSWSVTLNAGQLIQVVNDCNTWAAYLIVRWGEPLNYNISGYVKNSNGIGINSSNIYFSDGRNTTTSSNGYYSIGQVVSGTYTLNASKLSYLNNSLSVSVSNSDLVNQNITLATDFSGTNTIVASETIDYNSPVSSVNTSNIYLTTWINNTQWGFWSPLFISVLDGQPDTTAVVAGRIWGQNAYQFAYTLPAGSYGLHSFKIYCSVCTPTIIAETLLTYNNPADAPDTISLSTVGNNLSMTFWTNPLSRTLGNLQYNVTYDTFWPSPSTGNVLCGPGTCVSPNAWNGTKDLTSFISAYPMYYFGGNQVLIHANTIYNGIVIASADRLFQYNAPTPTLTSTPSPTVLPTPNVTQPNPIPTLPPLPNGTNNTNSPGDFNNYTKGQSDALNGSISGVGGYIAGTINGMRGGIQSINSSLAGFAYGVHMPILVILVGAVMAGIPAKVKLIFSLFFILVIVLIVMGRDKK